MIPDVLAFVIGADIYYERYLKKTVLVLFGPPPVLD
jgi:hypothetical protein